MLFDPLYYAVSALMWLWHELFALIAPGGVAWALSVVMLVATLRALLVKPFLAQVRSGRAAQAIAPQLAQLRERHRDDPATLLAQSRRLQADHGVSTAGMLVPALIQAPVFLGLLHVLNNFRPGLPNYVFGPEQVASFLDARLFGVPLSAYPDLLHGLDHADVLLVTAPLLVLAAVATHFSFRLQPTSTSIQRVLQWVVPIGLVVSGLVFPFPVGVLIYWLTSNVWTLVQQQLVYRRLDRATPPTPVRTPVTPPRPGAKPLRRRHP
jgi:YidC/Oxa1 family membrane protein insertase